MLQVYSTAIVIQCSCPNKKNQKENQNKLDSTVLRTPIYQLYCVWAHVLFYRSDSSGNNNPHRGHFQGYFTCGWTVVFTGVRATTVYVSLNWTIGLAMPPSESLQIQDLIRKSRLWEDASLATKHAAFSRVLWRRAAMTICCCYFSGQYLSSRAATCQKVFTLMILSNTQLDYI